MVRRSCESRMGRLSIEAEWCRLRHRHAKLSQPIDHCADGRDVTADSRQQFTPLSRQPSDILAVQPQFMQCHVEITQPAP